MSFLSNIEEKISVNLTGQHFMVLGNNLMLLTLDKLDLDAAVRRNYSINF